MKNSYWGVDSAGPITESGIALLPQKPDFWMRYLNYTPDVCLALTHSELTIALNHGIRVGLIWSGTPQEELTQDNHFMESACAQIQSAITRLQITNKVAVYLDVEAGTTPNLKAVSNYCNNLSARGIIPGLYYNGTLDSHQQASILVHTRLGRLWDCEPEYTEWQGLVLSFPETEPKPFVSIRQYQINQLSGEFDFNACNNLAYTDMVH